nr:hypothetical protein [Ornithinimicrobium cryptoxanthini]
MTLVAAMPAVTLMTCMTRVVGVVAVITETHLCAVSGVVALTGVLVVW